MAPSRTWLILVDQMFQMVGKRFWVPTSNDDYIVDLQKKVKEEKPKALYQVDPDELTVWKMKGAKIINTFASKERLARILESIDVKDEETIEELSEVDLVTDLGLSYGQVLLVQQPGTSRIVIIAIGCVTIQATAVTSREDGSPGDPIKSKVDEDPLVRGLIVRAENKGSFAEKDVDSNGIVDAGEVPEFVEKYEAMLKRKRKAPDNVGCFHLIIFNI
jgi:hypothetical protein